MKHGAMVIFDGESVTRPSFCHGEQASGVFGTAANQFLCVGLVYNSVVIEGESRLATITITVPAEVAEIYHASSEQERQKIQMLLGLWLKEAKSKETLANLMDTISDKAQARGLTPDILETLLNDES